MKISSSTKQTPLLKQTRSSMFARGWTSCAEVLAWGGGLLGRFLRRCLGDFVGGFWRVLWEVFSCILLCLHVFYLFFTIKFKNIFLLVFCYFLLLSPMNFLLTLFWGQDQVQCTCFSTRGSGAPEPLC